jgi:transcriptional regulator of aromatic amino acid metabolism
MHYRHDIENLAVDERDPATVMIADEDNAGASDDLCLPEHGIFDWQTIKALGNFAARNPTAWRTIAAKIDNGYTSYRELAKQLGVSHMTVCRHLKKLKTI